MLFKVYMCVYILLKSNLKINFYIRNQKLRKKVLKYN